MQKINKYLQIVSIIFSGRANESLSMEDEGRLFENLDDIWKSMSKDEKEFITDFEFQRLEPYKDGEYCNICGFTDYGNLPYVGKCDESIRFDSIPCKVLHAESCKACMSSLTSDVVEHGRRFRSIIKSRYI